MMKKAQFEWPQYDALANGLFMAGTLLSPAYFHGTMVALLCVDPQNKNATWDHFIIQAPNELMSTNTKNLLESLFFLTQSQLQGLQGIRLLLPEDEEPLTSRLEALGAWCEGFLEVASAMNEIKPNVKEVLSDFAQIKTLSSYAQENEENEKNYMEIVEFIRIGVLLIYDECMRLPIVEKQLH